MSIKQTLKSGMTIRIAIVILLIFTAAIVLGLKISWFSIEEKNIPTCIWMGVSLLSTLLLSLYSNWKFAKDLRNQKPYLNSIKSKSFLIVLNWITVFYIACVLMAICFGKLNGTEFLSLFVGPILVIFVILFDLCILNIEKEIFEIEHKVKLVGFSALTGGTVSMEQLKLGSCENITAYQRAKSVIRYLDWPIFVGVCITTIICFVLPNITNIDSNNITGYVSGFASGATSMQIIVANFAYEFINCTGD